MRRFFMILTVVLGMGQAAAAQEDEIQAVISGQIAALQLDDYTTAFGFASATIRRLFGTSDRFGQMVREGYPMVHRPADVRFLRLLDGVAGKAQRVMMRDAGGALHVLEYQMIETDDGWKINGVRVLDAGGLGA